MPDTPKIFIVPEECDGMRADKALAEMLPEMSRSRIQKIIDAGDVIWNEKPVAKKTTLPSGAELQITFPPEPATDLVPADIPLDILFEDEQVLDGEIFIKRISGHSHGSSIVLFEHNGKTAVLCGDECYTSRNLTEKIPTGASRDPQVSKAFVEEYSKEKYIAFTCHDPHIMRGQVGSKVLFDQSFSDRI